MPKKQKPASKKAAKEAPQQAPGGGAAGELVRPRIIESVSVSFAKAGLSEQFYRSVVVETLSITYHGHDILTDAELKLHAGNRYGLIGPNGCGKTTLMKCFAQGEIPVHPNIDLFFVNQEVEATDTTALECVLAVDRERERLETEEERLQANPTAEGEARLAEIYERLDALDADTAEVRAAKILSGLGFNHRMQNTPCKDYSGGWRMRIALAQGLFVNPTFLLLDEPSNHLDIEAVVWLEEYLKNFQGILLVVSHSQDFLNNVCTNCVRVTNKLLEYYKGNYDSYCTTREEQEDHQLKRYNWEQDQMKNMKEYIARFGHGSAKLARQAQSKEKTLAKMQRGGLTEKVHVERAISFYFPDPGTLNGSIIQFTDVSFGYNPEKILYRGLNFGVDLDSRIALVGPNGAGKTTLQKLMMGLLEPTDGVVSRNGHLRIVRFAQHFVDQLPFEMHPIAYMQSEFPELKDVQQVRSILGRFGCTGGQQLQSIGTLSEGQKARVTFAWMAWKSPHMLMLDEPTNALDMETIDSLADAINEFTGGMVLVSHDIRLISQVAKEIWICENGLVTPFRGDITAYKEHIRKIVQSAGEAYTKK